MVGVHVVGREGFESGQGGRSAAFRVRTSSSLPPPLYIAISVFPGESVGGASRACRRAIGKHDWATKTPVLRVENVRRFAFLGVVDGGWVFGESSSCPPVVVSFHSHLFRNGKD